MPKVSYLVSTYNAGHYLDQHLANLIEGQTDPDFEVIIINPNSPGTDHFIAEKWLQLDQRVRYIQHYERESYGSSWLRGWECAIAPFVVNSNTDDFHHPDFTSEFYKYMILMPEIGFSYAGITVIDELGHMKARGIKPPFDFEEYSHTCHGGPQLCWANNAKFKNKLDWVLMRERARQHQSAFDYWLILYFMSLGFHGYSIPKLLTIYTQRADSIENSNKWANNYETYAAISEFFGHHLDGRLKHAKEFRDFNNLPPKDEWVATMQRGKKWRG